MTNPNQCTPSPPRQNYYPPPEQKLTEAVMSWLKQQGLPTHIDNVRGLSRNYCRDRDGVGAWVLAFEFERPSLADAEEAEGPCCGNLSTAHMDLLKDGTYKITCSLACESEDWICGLESHCSAWWHAAHECATRNQCKPMPEPASYLNSSTGYVFAYPPKCWPMTVRNP